jgi:hypothetical protein
MQNKWIRQLNCRRKRREFQRNSANKYSFVGTKLVPNMGKVCRLRWSLQQMSLARYLWQSPSMRPINQSKHYPPSYLHRGFPGFSYWVGPIAQHHSRSEKPNTNFVIASKFSQAPPNHNFEYGVPLQSSSLLGFWSLSGSLRTMLLVH